MMHILEFFGWEDFSLMRYIWFSVLGIVLYFYKRFMEGGQYTKDHLRMDGKVVIITGANTGIGKETALDLAKRNAIIYMACKDHNRCEAARMDIIAKTGNTKIYNRPLDLRNLKSVRDFAEGFAKDEQHLDVLINNAGVFFLPHSITEDDCETTMQINHLGHFLLTHLLLELLKRSPQGRIVNVSSLGYGTAKIDKHDFDLQKPHNYSEFRAYSNSKLAQLLSTEVLADKLKGSNVTVNCLHTGVCLSELGRYAAKKLPNIVLWTISPNAVFLFFKSVKSGAMTTIFCAVDPDLAKVSGKFFSDCKKVNEYRLSLTPDAEEATEIIWRESLRRSKIPSNFSY